MDFLVSEAFLKLISVIIMYENWQWFRKKKVFDVIRAQSWQILGHFYSSDWQVGSR